MRTGHFPSKPCGEGADIRTRIMDLRGSLWLRRYLQETLNYWKQLPHILKYFRAEEDPNARRQQNFMSGFLEVQSNLSWPESSLANLKSRVGTECLPSFRSFVYISMNLHQTPDGFPFLYTPSNAMLFPMPSVLYDSI